MKSWFLSAFLLLSLMVNAQDDATTTNPANTKKAPVYHDVIDGIDPLGRLNYPNLGILPAIAFPAGIDPSITNYMGIAFANGMKGNAYTPYGAVSKDKFDEVKLVLAGLEKNDLKKYYWAEAIGVPILVRLDVNHFKMIPATDTIRQKPGDPKSPVASYKKYYHCFANLSASIIDVATTDLLLCHNFSVDSQTETSNPKPDSVSALRFLYEQIKGVGQSYHQLLAGVGVIDSMLEIKKDKAKVVRVNANKMMNLRGAGTHFEVYALGEVYDRDGVLYQHADPVGMVLKADDYHYTKLNFEVIKGESDLYSAFVAGKKLVCSMGTLPLSVKPATTAIPSITVDTFQVKVKGTSGLARMLQERTTDLLSRRSQLINVVNRNSFDDIETERAIQSKTKSEATQAGITIGADYLLTADIVNYQFKREPVKKTEEVAVAPPPATPAPAATTTKPAAAPKPAPPPPPSANPTSRSGATAATKTTTDTRSGSQPAAKTETKPAATPAPAKPKTQTRTVVVGTSVEASVSVEARLISVKSGEILWSKVLGASAAKQFPVDKNAADKLMQQEEVNALLVNNFASANVNAIFLGITKPLPILKVLETDKKGIDKILVGGGAHAGINPYMSMVVIEETSEMVDNQSLKRETVIAELKLDEVYPETASWKVKDGSAKLQEKMNANAKLYCKIR